MSPCSIAEVARAGRGGGGGCLRVIRPLPFVLVGCSTIQLLFDRSHCRGLYTPYRHMCKVHTVMRKLAWHPPPTPIMRRLRAQLFYVTQGCIAVRL
jgi:hypothetical protein